MRVPYPSAKKNDKKQLGVSGQIVIPIVIGDKILKLHLFFIGLFPAEFPPV